VVERRTRVLGADHFSTVDSRSNLGIVMLQTGHLEEAQTHLRYVLKAYQQRFPQGNNDVGECHANLADALATRGNIEEAREHLEAAAQIFGGEDSEGWRYGVTLISIGTLGGDAPTPEALAAARNGLALAERALGPEHPRYADLAVDVAEAELLSGDASTARQRIEAVLPVISNAEDAYVIARSKMLLGKAVRTRAPDRARDLFREAHELLPAISESTKKAALVKQLGEAR
jgi:tetratricopeptide (TPR) repeat protein